MEHNDHHKRELKFLISFLVIFMIIFMIALVNIRRGTTIFGLGLPYLIEDGIILVLSFLSIVKVFWNILVH